MQGPQPQVGGARTSVTTYRRGWPCPAPGVATCTNPRMPIVRSDGGPRKASVRPASGPRCRDPGSTAQSGDARNSVVARCRSYSPLFAGIGLHAGRPTLAIDPNGKLSQDQLRLVNMPSTSCQQDEKLIANAVEI